MLNETISDTILSEAQAAAYLGISRSFLQKDRVRERQLPFFRIGKRCLYRKTDLDAFIAQQTVGGMYTPKKFR
jgi:excisionase family DNA binding protein